MDRRAFIKSLAAAPAAFLQRQVTEPGRRMIFRRPDGSLTHW